MKNLLNTKKSISQLQYNWLTGRAIFNISTEENVIQLFNIYLDLLLSNLLLDTDLPQWEH